MGKELFDNIPSKVSDLLSDVKNGRIGLPDLQRPFVWKDNKVRELLDSMMKGYPIGYIMLWSSPDDYENTGHIGKNEKVYKRPDDLVIDGQQRLTALLAAMYGVTIKDQNYEERKIKISFNPLTCEFAVWTQAYERNPEWISEICSVFAADQEHTISRFRKSFIRSVNESREKNGEELLTEEEEDVIEENINNLLNLGIYSLPTLKISSKADEEDVAEVEALFGEGVTFTDVLIQAQQQRGLYYAFATLVYGFLSIIVAITIFHIMNTISMGVSARTRQYGVMRAIGMSNQQLTRMISAEAASYAISGVILGCIFGLLFHWFLYSSLITRTFGNPWSVPWLELCLIIGVILATTALAVRGPARRLHAMSIVENISSQ